jgi:hypothetical protein
MSKHGTRVRDPVFDVRSDGVDGIEAFGSLREDGLSKKFSIKREILERIAYHFLGPSLAPRLERGQRCIGGRASLQVIFYTLRDGQDVGSAGRRELRHVATEFWRNSVDSGRQWWSEKMREREIRDLAEVEHSRT